MYILDGKALCSLALRLRLPRYSMLVEHEIRAKEHVGGL